MNVLHVRIFPLCVPALSSAVEHRLLKLVRCYVSSSTDLITANDNDDEDQCDTVYDGSSLEADDDVCVDRDSTQQTEGRWTVDNGQ